MSRNVSNIGRGQELPLRIYDWAHLNRNPVIFSFTSRFIPCHILSCFNPLDAARFWAHEFINSPRFVIASKSYSLLFPYFDTLPEYFYINLSGLTRSHILSCFSTFRRFRDTFISTYQGLLLTRSHILSCFYSFKGSWLHLQILPPVIFLFYSSAKRSYFIVLFCHFIWVKARLHIINLHIKECTPLVLLRWYIHREIYQVVCEYL